MYVLGALVAVAPVRSHVHVATKVTLASRALLKLKRQVALVGALAEAQGVVRHPPGAPLRGTAAVLGAPSAVEGRKATVVPAALLVPESRPLQLASIANPGA